MKMPQITYLVYEVTIQDWVTRLRLPQNYGKMPLEEVSLSPLMATVHPLIVFSDFVIIIVVSK